MPARAPGVLLPSCVLALVWSVSDAVATRTGSSDGGDGDDSGGCSDGDGSSDGYFQHGKRRGGGRKSTRRRPTDQD